MTTGDTTHMAGTTEEYIHWGTIEDTTHKGGHTTEWGQRSRGDDAEGGITHGDTTEGGTTGTQQIIVWYPPGGGGLHIRGDYTLGDITEGGQYQGFRSNLSSKVWMSPWRGDNAKDYKRGHHTHEISWIEQGSL